MLLKLFQALQKLQITRSFLIAEYVAIFEDAGIMKMVFLFKPVPEEPHWLSSFLKRKNGSKKVKQDL
jgi:hypothetical protein